MNTMIRTATTAAGFLAAFALPIASQAATSSTVPPQRYVFQTRTTESFHAGEYDGTLRLTIYANGIVSGTFQPSDGGARSVSGGMSGTHIWFDIGMQRSVHLDGTLKNGVIQAVENIPGPDVYTFVATTEPNTH